MRQNVALRRECYAFLFSLLNVCRWKHSLEWSAVGKQHVTQSSACLRRDVGENSIQLLTSVRVKYIGRVGQGSFPRR